MYIVTGAAGFIGSCIIKKLNDEGVENIIVVDRLEKTDKWLNLRGLKFAEYLHADDFIDPDMLASIFEEGVSQVYHMGACSSTTERDVDYLMTNNVEYSKILFSYCSGYDVPIVYASSAATYGDGASGHEDTSVSELKPLNAYGWSKQLVDEWALKLDETPSKWFGVKFFNVYGPNEYHKENMKSVVCQAHEQINKTSKMKLFKSYKSDYKDGEQLRDFVYVKDVVNVMYELLNRDHPGASGIYNLGTGTARSFKALVEATFSAMNVKADIEFIEMPESLQGQYQYFTEANMSKLSTALPKFEFYSLEEGITDYVQNYLMKKDKFLTSRG